MAIFFFSTDRFSGDRTGNLLWSIIHLFFPGMTIEEVRPVNFMIRKAAHFTEYGILALLLFRAFRSGAATRWRLSWAIYTQLIIIGSAFLDEYHQSFVRSRTSSVYDSLIDTAGGFTALVLLWLRGRKRED